MNIYLHVGYPKCASTMLQTDVFPFLKNIFYLGRFYNRKTAFLNKKITNEICKISFAESLEFDLKKTKRVLIKEIKKIAKRKKNILISWEAFSHNVVDRKNQITRLGRIFPKAKILIILRNQIESIESMYTFLLKQQGDNINLSYGRPSVLSLQQWLRDQEEFPWRSYLSTLNYFNFVKAYQNQFGKNNVKILFFEDLAMVPDQFFSALANFFKQKTALNKKIFARNKRLSDQETEYYRLCYKYKNFKLHKKLPNCLKKLIKKTIVNLFTNNNQKQSKIKYFEAIKKTYYISNKKLFSELKIKPKDKYLFKKNK